MSGIESFIKKSRVVMVVRLFMIALTFTMFVSCKSLDKQTNVLTDYDISSRNPSSVLGEFAKPVYYCKFQLHHLDETMKRYWGHVKKGNLDCVEYYLRESKKAGHDLVYQKDDKGMTTIMHAAKNGDFEMLCSILEKFNDNATQDDRNFADNKGRTALHHAVQGRRGVDKLITQILLIDAGIDHTIRDHEYRTAKQYATDFAFNLAKKTGDHERFMSTITTSTSETYTTPITNEIWRDFHERPGRSGDWIRRQRNGFLQTAEVIQNHEKNCYLTDGVDCTMNKNQVGSMCDNLLLAPQKVGSDTTASDSDRVLHK